MLTTVNDEHWASDFVPLALIYRSTVQYSREDLVNQLAIRWPELGRGDPLVDNTLRGGVVTKIYPVQGVYDIRRQLIRTIVRALVTRFLEKDELFPVLFVLRGGPKN